MGKKKRGKLRGDIVALRAAVAGMKGEEVCEGGGEESYSALRRDQPVCDFGEGRKCACCGCSLARSNPDEFCRPCDRAIAEWKNFPWNRAEIEKRMAKHCLCFVQSGTKKKRSCRGVSRIAVSGSFLRAIGVEKSGEK